MQTMLAQHRLFRPSLFHHTSRRGLLLCNSKGFGVETKAPQKQAPKEEQEETASTSSSTPSSTDRNALALEALESRIKSRRKRIEPKVKVVAPAVDVATGKAPAPAESEAERAYLVFLSFYFLGVILLGLALSASGFLPEEVDALIQDKLYPSYSWIVLGFLGLSSVYGLYKTGKLPGQTQQQ